MNIITDRTSLLALSPLDGRYLLQTIELREYFSEGAFIKERILVEVLYLIDLMEFLDQIKLTKQEKNKLLKWVRNLQPKDLIKVKKIERETCHDVKAIEYFIKSNLKKLKLTNLFPWIHWGLTSEDVNNLAYALMIQNAKDKVLIPGQDQLIKVLLKLASKHNSVVMPARTH